MRIERAHLGILGVGLGLAVGGRVQQVGERQVSLRIFRLQARSQCAVRSRPIRRLLTFASNEPSWIR